MADERDVGLVWRLVKNALRQVDVQVSILRMCSVNRALQIKEVKLLSDMNHGNTSYVDSRVSYRRSLTVQYILFSYRERSEVSLTDFNGLLDML